MAKVHESVTTVSGLNGKVDKVYTADEITFNFARLSQKVNNIVSFGTSKVSKNVSMEISGDLGRDAIELLILHIDYRDGLVKFEYIPNFGYKFDSGVAATARAEREPQRQVRGIANPAARTSRRGMPVPLFRDSWISATIERAMAAGVSAPRSRPVGA